jgi:hypothetical protein
VINFTTQMLYPRGSLVPLERRQGGSQRQSGCGGKEKNSHPCWELNPGYPAQSLFTTLTEISQVSPLSWTVFKRKEKFQKEMVNRK